MAANLVQLNMGEVAERFKAAVLKTVEGQPSGGSNPSLSAISNQSGRLGDHFD